MTQAVGQPPTPLDLTQHAALVDAYLGAEAEAHKWEQVANTLKEQIRALMGEATHATCRGVPTFTYKPVDKLHAGRFREAEPELYAKYTRPVTVTELDREALKTEHPDVYNRYRSRQFNRLVNLP